MLLPTLTNSTPTVRKFAGMTAVVIGDDFAVGDSASFKTTKKMYVPDSSYWPNLIETHSGMKIINKATIGATTTTLIQRFKADVLDLKPGYCFIMAGVSDAINFIPYSTILANLKEIVERARGGGIIPVVLLPVPCNSVGDIENILHPLRTEMINWCKEEDVFHLNLCGEPFIKSSKQDFAYYLGDHKYCSALGHMTIATALDAYLDVITDITGDGVYKYTPIGIAVDEKMGIWTWIDKDGDDVFDELNPVPTPPDINRECILGIAVDEKTGIWTWIDGDGNDMFPDEPNPEPPSPEEPEEAFEEKEVTHETVRYEGGWTLRESVKYKYKAPKDTPYKIIWSCEHYTEEQLRYYQQVQGLYIVFIPCKHKTLQEFLEGIRDLINSQRG